MTAVEIGSVSPAIRDGAADISLPRTFRTRREQHYCDVVNESATSFAQATRERIHWLATHFMSHGMAREAAATHKAIAAVGAAICQPANILAFNDTFGLLGVALAVGSLPLRTPAHLEAGASH
jgi:DHA2 family multidrug resistance protein